MRQVRRLCWRFYYWRWNMFVIDGIGILIGFGIGTILRINHIWPFP